MLHHILVVFRLSTLYHLMVCSLHQTDGMFVYITYLKYLLNDVCFCSYRTE